MIILTAFSRLKPVSPWDKLVHWGITLFTGGKVDHAFFIYKEDNSDRWMTLGALFSGVEIIPLREFRQKREVVAVYAPKGWSLEDGFKQIALAKVGEKYDFAGIVGMVWVETLRRFKVDHPHNPFNPKDEVFCSYLVSEVIKFSMKLRGILNDWSLASVSSDSIDPNQLMEAEDKSYFFSKLPVNFK